MSLESIIAAIDNEEVRGQFSTIASKVPHLKDLVETGERFQPVVAKLGNNFSSTFERLNQMNPQLAAERIARLPEWVDYQDRNWLPDVNMYRSEKESQDRAAQLEAELVELRARGVGEVTEEQLNQLLDKRFKDAGLVTKAELSAPNGPLANGLNGQAARFEEVYTALDEKRFSHESTFKEAIPTRQVMKYMADNNERDPLKAYEAVTAKQWAEHNKKLHDEEIAAAEKRGEEKARLVRAQGEGGNGMPVNSGATNSKMPHFMAKVFRDRETRAKGSVPGRLGDGTAAREGFAAYQKAQNAVTGSI